MKRINSERSRRKLRGKEDDKEERNENFNVNSSPWVFEEHFMLDGSDDMSLKNEDPTEETQREPTAEELEGIAKKRKRKLNYYDVTYDHPVPTKDGKIHQCRICRKYLKNVTTRNRHEIEKHPPPLPCEFCQKTFTTVLTYHTHRNIHLGLTKFKCKFCGKYLASRSNLEDHEKVHTKERPIECPQCDKTFSSTSNLRVHLKFHAGVKTYFCHVCGKGHVTIGNLKLHVKRHSNERSHVCHICGKGFNGKSELNKHIESHNNEKKYSCQYCLQKLKTPNSLRRHINIQHLKLRPYKCDVCNKDFGRRENLKEHMQIHALKKEFCCELCSRQFTHDEENEETEKNLNAMCVIVPGSEQGAEHREKMIESLETSTSYLMDAKECYDTADTKEMSEKRSLKTVLKTKDRTEQCELCFNYFDKSYIWTHKTKIHRVLKDVPKRKNFKCKECDNTFQFKSELIRHQNMEHLYLEEICNVCEEKVLKKDIDVHKLTMHGMKKRTSFTCQQCDTTFNTRGDLQRHKFEEHCLPGAGRPMVPCDICHKTFLKTSITKHKFEVHNIRDELNLRKGKEAKCEDCGLVFKRRYELNKHRYVEHVKEKPGKRTSKYCDLCQSVVETGSLARHKLVEHGVHLEAMKPRKNYKCSDCGEVFINKKVYISHRKVTHLGILKEFQCKLCLDTFDTKELWDEHMVEYGDHGGQFTCSICNRTFQSEGGLRMHQNKHQQKFQCDVCHMNLSSNASLITHKAKHSGLKPYECQLCFKSFPYASSLKYHMRTHEDKKYVCQFCGQKFTFSFNFTRHIEQNHGKPEEKLVCEHCGGLFAKRRMKDHLARHGEPTIPCELCGKKFKVLNQVRKHKNQVHKKELVRHECPVCAKVFIRKEVMQLHLSKHSSTVSSQPMEKDVEEVQSPLTLDLPQMMLYYNQ